MYLENARLYSDIASDKVVMQGLSALAAALRDLDNTGCDGYYENPPFMPLDFSPLSLRIDTAGRTYEILIPRYSITPTRKLKTVSTLSHDQEKVVLNIYEGERPMTKYNRYLGSLELNGLPRKKKGDVKIEVSFELDSSYLVVIAKEQRAENEVRIKIDEKTLSH